MSALELFTRATRRGLRFYRVSPQTVGIGGPTETIRELEPEIDARALDLVAIVEEFSADSAPVQAATAILTGHLSPVTDVRAGTSPKERIGSKRSGA